MSNWGIGLLISPGPGGRPEAVLLRDAEAHCGKCGWETVERTYESTSLHATTTRVLSSLLDAGAPSLAQTCLQCGDAVGPEHVVRWVIHFGFMSGRGLIQGFGTTDGARRWLLSPHQAMDVQLVPAWENTADRSREEVEALDEPTVARVFGRAFQPKQRVREWVATSVDAHDDTLHYLGPGTYVQLLRPDDANELDAVIASARKTLDQSEPEAGPWHLETLVHDGEPADTYPHAPAAWLSGLDDALEGLTVLSFVGLGRVKPALEHIVSGFPIQLLFEPIDEETLRMRLPDLDGWPDHPTLDLTGIGAEAARTMLTIDDAARVELERLLQSLTRLNHDDTPETDPEPAEPAR
ncbi:MAG: hypothetical protein ACJA1R_000171 [Flavobacteriales bacterium]|jgi:hypothetical protein